MHLTTQYHNLLCLGLMCWVLEVMYLSDQLQGASNFDETTRPVKTCDHKSLVLETRQDPGCLFGPESETLG